MPVSSVEPVTPSDIEALREIAEECELSPWSYQNFVDELVRGDSIMLLIRDGSGKAIGFIVGRIISTDSSAEIYNIGVIKEFRRTGKGKILLDEFLKRARQANAEKAWLEVRSQNAVAIIFYEQNGFRPLSKRRNFYTDPVDDAFVMEFDFSTSGRE